MTKLDKIKYFKSRVSYYFYDFFKLSDYELTITGQDKFDTRGSAYWHSYEEASAMCTICYSNGWISSGEVTKYEIDKIAFHEVCECLLQEINKISRERFISEVVIEHSIHQIIRRIENSVYPLIKDKV